MVKTILKLLLSVLVYTVLFLVGNALLPFSPEFKELGASGAENPLWLLFMLVNSAWVCFAMYFIIRHTHFGGKKLFFYLLGIMFFVQQFMTQIETLLFGFAFPVLTKPDILLIMFAGLLPLLATIPLLIKFFQNKGTSSEKANINIKNTLLKLGIIGAIYLFIYMFFGYFVAWQFTELRVFYTGSAEKLSFWRQVFSNSPAMLFFQIMRGILFAAFITPLIIMLHKNKIVFITSVCLVYLCTAVMLVIPNALFPDMVRFAHLIEMVSSMLFFGIIVGNIMWNKRKIA
jgi:hypothetical protein